MNRHTSHTITAEDHELDAGVAISRLGNGLTVISHHMPQLETVALGIWVEAGSRDEAPQEAGIAHFLEHMAFKGTRKRSAFDIVAAIEDRGGDLNAATSPENTGYTAHVLKDDWQTALDVLADIVCDPVFDAGEMERERGVILQEIAAAQDDPGELAFEQAEAIAWRDHPLGRPVLGTPEVVSRLKPEDLAAFRARHYGAARMVVAAAGAIEHAQLEAQVQRLLGHLPAGTPRRLEMPLFHAGERTLARGHDQTHVVLAWPYPSLQEDDLWPAQALAAVLGGGMSSRLFQQLREQRGLCYATYTYQSTFHDAGALFLYAATAPEHAAQAEELMLSIARASAQGISEAELSRARAQARAALVMSLESATARAGQMARQYMAWGTVPPMRLFHERLAAITTQEVAHIAARCFAADPVRSRVVPLREEEAQRPRLLH